MNRYHIPCFWDWISWIDQQSYLPKFKDKKGDDVSFHFIKFHMHIDRLGVDFHEDCLMRMFMVTLKGKAWSWYEGLSPTSIYSLKDFYTVFYKNYKDNYSSIALVETFCHGRFWQFSTTFRNWYWWWGYDG